MRKGGSSMRNNSSRSLLSLLFGLSLLAAFVGCAGSRDIRSEYDSLPKLREYTPPAFPEEFRQPQANLEVLLDVRIDAEGNVLGVQMAESSGETEIDLSAVSAVRKWKYYPATKDGKPLPAVVRQKVIFSTRPLTTVTYYEIVVSRKELADSLWKVLDTGADFAEIAKKFSEGESAAQGGLRENVRYESLSATMKAEIDKLVPGQISQPFQGDNNKYIIIKREQPEPTFL
jgi:TonB family protein